MASVEKEAEASFDHVEALKPVYTVNADGDVAAQLIDIDHAVIISPADNARVLRRVDWVLMPILFISFGIQFLDKLILSSAAQFGILKDLDLVTTVIINGKPATSSVRYSYATFMFYWGFLAGCK